VVRPPDLLAGLRRPPDAHKGLFGHVLVLAGSTGFVGAGCLAAEAALASGAGLATLGVPHSLLPIVATKLTACMTHGFREVPLPGRTRRETVGWMEDWMGGGLSDIHPSIHSSNLPFGGALALGALPEILAFAGRCNVVALGPGIGRHRSTERLVHALVRSLDRTLVLDADALNALEGQADLLDEAPAPRILTPHPGEMSRLTGLATPQIQADRMGVASEFAARHKVVLALKGYHTIVADGTDLYENETGNPGMATGGTGDVLTGMVAGLCAQGLAPFSAACLAVYLHGLAGDLAAKKIGEHSLTATDVLAFIGSAFQVAMEDASSSSPVGFRSSRG